ncbi:hypothetical protein PVAP13_8NG247500 [Panicum virgatum]|uniref:Uncharacterized protein n=1 Tax=Panicum virgatum TaxID=38727 RepID=A0A8T0P9G9_PANVG|nr:hypothetical protein PVAP13_8NG247500 [Panicum virgatum]
MDHAGNPNDIGGMEEDEDLVPLSTRLNKFKSVAKEPVSSYGTVSGANTVGDDTIQVQNKIEPRGDALAPATTVPAAQEDQEGKKLGSFHTRRERLMLPPKPPITVNDNKNTPATKICSNIDEDSMSSGKRAGPSASGGKRSSWDFPPTEFDIMGSLEEPTPLGEGTSGSHPIQFHDTTLVMPNKYSTEPVYCNMLGGGKWLRKDHLKSGKGAQN